MMRTGVLYGGEAETFGFGRTECAAFTGYRPAKFLAAFPQGDARQRVGELLRPVVAGLYDLGVRLFLSGMAEGFDLGHAVTPSAATHPDNEGNGLTTAKKGGRFAEEGTYFYRVYTV